MRSPLLIALFAFPIPLLAKYDPASAHARHETGGVPVFTTHFMQRATTIPEWVLTPPQVADQTHVTKEAILLPTSIPAPSWYPRWEQKGLVLFKKGLRLTWRIIKGIFYVNLILFCMIFFQVAIEKFALKLG